jgi:hypothetical protein
LEERRQALLDRLDEFQEFTPGSLQEERARRCGKAACHCAKPGDPGHGPRLSVMRYERGRTVRRTVPAALAGVVAERVGRWGEFQAVCAEVADVNQELSVRLLARGRPVPGRGAPGAGVEKGGLSDRGLAALQAELERAAAAEVAAFMAAARAAAGGGGRALDLVEKAARESARELGRVMVEGAANLVAAGAPAPGACGCGAPARVHSVRARMRMAS